MWRFRGGGSRRRRGSDVGDGGGSRRRRGCDAGDSVKHGAFGLAPLPRRNEGPRSDASSISRRLGDDGVAASPPTTDPRRRRDDKKRVVSKDFGRRENAPSSSTSAGFVHIQAATSDRAATTYGIRAENASANVLVMVWGVA